MKRAAYQKALEAQHAAGATFRAAEVELAHAELDVAMRGHRRKTVEADARVVEARESFETARIAYLAAQAEATALYTWTPREHEEPRIRGGRNIGL